MEFKNLEIRDVLGPETIEQAQKYVGKAGYFADSLVELERVIDKKDNLLSYGKLRKTTDYHYLLGGSEGLPHIVFRYFLPEDRVKR